MSDVEYVMNVFKVDKDRAEELIKNGLNVSYIRNGINSFDSLFDVKDRLKDTLDVILKEELK